MYSKSESSMLQNNYDAMHIYNLDI
jgi:hypothetical protein